MSIPPQPQEPASSRRRKLGIAYDESDYAVRWAINNCILPGDYVFIIHVTHTLNGRLPNFERLLDTYAASAAEDAALPLIEAEIPHEIHIVKDQERMVKERLCLEIERLGLSAVVMGSRGFGARAISDACRVSGLGSVTSYCVRHSVCPVVVVPVCDYIADHIARYPAPAPAPAPVPTPEELRWVKYPVIIGCSSFKSRKKKKKSPLWNSHPKSYASGSRTCRACGNRHGLIRKYGLMFCRQCFRSNAKEIGFIKYS